jgi:hypothetical protein
MNHYRRPGFGLWWMIVAIAMRCHETRISS